MGRGEKKGEEGTGDERRVSRSVDESRDERRCLCEHVILCYPCYGLLPAKVSVPETQSCIVDLIYQCPMTVLCSA